MIIQRTRSTISLAICNILLGILFSLPSGLAVYEIIVPTYAGPESEKLGITAEGPFNYVCIPGFIASILLIVIGAALLLKWRKTINLVYAYAIANAIMLVMGAFLFLPLPYVSDYFFSAGVVIVISGYTFMNAMIVRRNILVTKQDMPD